MIFRVLLIVTLFYLWPLVPQVFSETKLSQTPPSVNQLVGETGWQVDLKDFSLRTEKNGNIFLLRAGDESYLSFSAYKKEGGGTDSFGPLLPEYAPTLAALLNYAFKFGELDKKDPFSMNVEWKLYPQSVRNWAAVWKASPLREQWKDLGLQQGYPRLVAMITGQLQKDFKPLAQALGYEISDASMEKMAFQEADRLKFFKTVLKPAGIPPDLELPMPLILSIRLNPVRSMAAVQADNHLPIAADSLFYSAKSATTSIYCSFQRKLNEYEISGDEMNPDETYRRILPLTQKKYRSVAGQLLKACLRATRGDEKASIALRLDPGLYPKVYEVMVKRFTFSPDLAKKAPVPWPQLPKLQFYAFDLSKNSGFSSAVKPFLEANGYVFGHLLVSVESGRKAASYPDYGDRFKALGIGPEDRPTVPNVVYLIAEKRQE